MKRPGFGTGAAAPAAVLALLVVLSAAAATPVATTISGPSPFAGCSRGGTDGLFAEAEVEPSLAVDPGGREVRGCRLPAGSLLDRRCARARLGRFGRRRAELDPATQPFSACAEGTTTNWPRASDPWVSIGGDGRVYAISIGRGVAVSSSGDHGKDWSPPTVIATNSDGFLTDKPTVTADPGKSGTAYAVWQRYLTRPDGPPIESDTMLSVTHDGGKSWGRPTLVLRHSADAGDVASVILVDRARPRLYHLAYWQAGGFPGPGIEHLSQLLVQRSDDGGRTWSKPRRITAFHTAGGRLRDPASGKIIRPGVPSFAIDAATGALYAAWQDSRFSSGAPTRSLSPRP